MQRGNQQRRARPRWLWSLLVALVVLLVWMAWMGGFWRPNVKAPERVVQVPAPTKDLSPKVRPVASPPLVLEVAADESPLEPSPPPTPWRCPAVDDALVDMAAEAERRCGVLLEEAGCISPTPFPEGAMAPAKVWEAFAGTAAYCGVPESAVAMDCTEYPCLLLVDVRVLGPHIGCPTLTRVRDFLSNNPPDSALLAGLGPSDHEFIGEMLFPPNDASLQVAGSAMRGGLARFHERMRLIGATNLDTWQGGLTMAPADCAAREAMLDAAGGDDEAFCEAVLYAWGCETRDLEAFDEAVDEALMVAEERFAPECSNIDLRDVRVDCTLFPCVVTYPEPEEGAVLCDDEARGESGWTPLGTLTTLPLLPGDDEEAQRVFEAHRGFRAADARRGYLMEVDPDLVDEVAAP